MSSRTNDWRKKKERIPGNRCRRKMGPKAPVQFDCFEIQDDLPPFSDAEPDVAPIDEIRVAESAFCTLEEFQAVTVVGDANVYHDGAYPPNRITFRTTGYNVKGDLTAAYQDLLADLYSLNIGSESCILATERMMKMM